MSRENPTASIPLNYTEFVESRINKNEQHLIEGIPDYAFSLDHTIRKKLNRIPFLVKAVEGMLSLRVPFKGTVRRARHCGRAKSVSPNLPNGC